MQPPKHEECSSDHGTCTLHIQTAMKQQQQHHRRAAAATAVVGAVALALLASPAPASAFLMPPLGAPKGSSMALGRQCQVQQQQQQQLGRPGVAAALVRRRAAGGTGGGSAGGDGEANTPGQGGMPDLEGMERPMPMGGESQYDYVSEYPDQQAEIEYFGDEELLQRYRNEMQESNDQWQLDVFMKAQAGTWSGVWSEYTPVPNGGANGETVFRMTNIYKGRQECVGDREARVARWRDLTLLHAPDGGPLAPTVVGEREMVPTNFRGAEGSMAADNVFSCSTLRTLPDGRGEAFDAETWIREGNYRTRVSFHYVAAGGPESGAAFALEKVIVKKERLGKQGPTAEEPELFGASGPGVYDRTSRTPGSWDLTLHGGLSLAFPPELPRGAKGSVIVDWVAGRMRYQADRIFLQPDGTLHSLEVTQIGSSDSMLYPIPEAPPAEEGAAESP